MGFILEGSNGNQLTGNTASQNQADGFLARTSAWALLTGNAATDNGSGGGNGFVFLATSDLRVENNVAKGSPWTCFGLYSGTTRATLVGNTASGCAAGFDLNEGAHDNTPRGNRANNNVGGNGFSLEAASANVLSDNTANGNNFGFNVNGAGASGNTRTRNTANRNTLFGFAASEGASHNAFSSNTAHANGELDALEAWPDGGDTWAGNHFGTTSGI